MRRNGEMAWEVRLELKPQSHLPMTQSIGW